MADCLMQSVVFHVVLVFNCLGDNPRPGELLVTCPLTGDFKDRGFAIYASKKGDNTDTSLVFACNWPDGSQGKKDCSALFSISLVDLGERHVDLSVPTIIFSINSTFNVDDSDNFPCVFDPGVIPSTPSTSTSPDTGTDQSDDGHLVGIIVGVISILVLVVVTLLFFFYRRRIISIISLCHAKESKTHSNQDAKPECEPMALSDEIAETGRNVQTANGTEREKDQVVNTHNDVTPTDLPGTTVTAKKKKGRRIQSWPLQYSHHQSPDDKE